MQNDSSIFASFTYCPYKAFLQFKEEAGRDDALDLWFNRQSAEYRNSIIDKQQIGPNGPNALRDRWIGFKRGSIDGELIICKVGEDCEILAQDIESTEKQGTGYVPLLCLPSEKISNQQKLLLAFASYSLAKAGYTGFQDMPGSRPRLLTTFYDPVVLVGYASDLGRGWLHGYFAAAIRLGPVNSWYLDWTSAFERRPHQRCM